MSREIRIYCDGCTLYFKGRRNEKTDSVFMRLRQHGWADSKDHTVAYCPSCKDSMSGVDWDNEKDWKNL